jgi:hypothetical protein
MVSTRIPSRLVVVIVAAVSWFAVGCPSNNTVIGPMATATPIPATATPIPTPTPTPTPTSATLQGHLTANRPGGLVPVQYGTVSVQQGSRILEATAGVTDGFYVVSGLEAGVASVTATGSIDVVPFKGTATITLQLGLNELDMLLAAQR